MDISALRLMELKDVKVSRMISDSADGEPVYDTPIDLAGILSLQISPELDSKELYGDSQLMDSYARTTSLSVTVTNAVVSLSGLEVILGGKISSEGAGEEEKVLYTFKSENATPPYFKIEGKWDYVGETIGDAHIVIYKCKISEAPEFTINDSSGDFGECSFTAAAMPTRKDGKWWEMVLNKTAKPIELTSDLESIAVTTQPTKASYTVGEALDLAGMIVTGTYSDGSKKELSVTMSNITGFSSSEQNPSQEVTVTVGDKTATFTVAITE